jgi:hypothetical protein
MTDEQTAGYITHHLKLAGRADTLFSSDAVTLIHDAARGLPRAVNNLATQALVAAMAGRRTSSTSKAPAPPSPRSRQTDHHRASPHTTAPPAPSRRGRRLPWPHVPIANDRYIVILSDRGHQLPEPSQPRPARRPPDTAAPR